MSARAVCGCGWVGTITSPAHAAAAAVRHVCKDAGVRRATRRHRCARCGFEAVYENAGAAEACHWFGKHSCQKRELAMVRTALVEQRRALVDRTPKPCLHKVAEHQHGTPACYVLDRCRCLPCSEANAARESERKRLQAYGRYNKYVSAEHVRVHLAELAEYGIGLKRVAALSGVSTGTLSKIVFGVYPTTGTGGGRNGPGRKVREPSRRVLRKTAEALYAVEAIPANLSPGAADHDRTPTARLHLRALVSIGWTQSDLGRRLGMKYATNITPVINDGRTLSRRMVDAIEALYSDLSMTPAPTITPSERTTATRARNYAEAHGWLPPLALDEPDDVAVEVDQVDVDEVAILRRVQGDHSVPLTAEERREVVRQLHARGHTDSQIAAISGINADRVRTDRRDLGLDPNARQDQAPVSSEHFSARGKARREAIAS